MADMHSSLLRTDEKSPIWILFALFLTVGLISLKLIGWISWGWLWILAPLWLPLAGAVLGGIWLTILLWIENL